MTLLSFCFNNEKSEKKTFRVLDDTTFDGAFVSLVKSLRRAKKSSTTRKNIDHHPSDVLAVILEHFSLSGRTFSPYLPSLRSRKL